MGQGEVAIRAELKAKRAAARKPESFNDAVSNRTDEVLARLEAESALRPPEHLVSSCGEAIRPAFFRLSTVDTLKNPNMVNVIASEHRVDLAASVGSGVAEAAVDAAQSAQAENSLEKMVCHQMAAAHHAALKLLARSLAMSGVPVEMARLANAAARMMQVCQEGLLTLQKLRTGGKQTVVVQHVQVSEGGQAVIAGSVASGEGLVVAGEGGENCANTP
jgi:predicted component of type VI protein secretion system